jgi:hypothetical protein
MELKIRSKQVEEKGLHEISKCFKCSFILDFDWDGSGFDTYILTTNENPSEIIKRLYDSGFTDIKSKSIN